MGTSEQAESLPYSLVFCPIVSKTISNNLYFVCILSEFYATDFAHR